jgi:diacylglycerol kinase
MLNTAIEKLCDFVSPEKHDAIKAVKDISVAAVLTSAVIAVIVGVIIFLPKIV